MYSLKDKRYIEFTEGHVIPSQNGENSSLIYSDEVIWDVIKLFNIHKTMKWDVSALDHRLSIALSSYYTSIVNCKLRITKLRIYHSKYRIKPV